MCSRKWPELLGPDAVNRMLDAVSAVAGNSFFATVDRCDDPRFAAMAGVVSVWWVAAIRFTEADGAGVVTCTIGGDLAAALFDAFAGRGPDDPPPADDAVVDLVGEFANMVCGTWLTRLATRQTFTLERPSVRRVSGTAPLPPADARVLVTVNDLPLAVDVRILAHETAGSGV